jgi:hypothetical protein
MTSTGPILCGARGCGQLRPTGGGGDSDDCGRHAGGCGGRTVGERGASRGKSRPAAPRRRPRPLVRNARAVAPANHPRGGPAPPAAGAIAGAVGARRHRTRTRIGSTRPGGKARKAAEDSAVAFLGTRAWWVRTGAGRSACRPDLPARVQCTELVRAAGRATGAARVLAQR